MIRETLVARIAPTASGRVRVLAPRLGWWSEQPRPGSLLAPGSGIGRLKVLHRLFELVLPPDVAGRVVGDLPADRVAAVEYGTPLFELAEIAGGQGDSDQPTAAPGRVAQSLPDGAHAVVAPTDGVFYHRAAPDSPPFVEVGARLTAGQTVGLIEVMKTFNQILYEGPGLPDPAEVSELRVEDGTEVRAGQILVVVQAG